MSFQDIPDKLMLLLPSDPFEQMDIARRIAEMAWQARVSVLEAELELLRGGSDGAVRSLQMRVVQLETDLKIASTRLAESAAEQNILAAQNNALSLKLKTLNRQLASLETFKRTLMQQLEDESDEDVQFYQRGSVTPTSQNVDPGHSGATAAHGASDSFGRGGEKQSRTRGPNSAVATPILSPSYPSMPNEGAEKHKQPGRGVDGKEFFRLARGRLSYEHFSSFLTLVRELNDHQLTLEETLKKAGDIFGPQNEDLLVAFEGLLRRHNE